MKNPKISIVANFYNSGRYIPKLIKSVLKQSFEDWELIAVNDCSPGNDMKILRKWEKHPEMKGRMRIIDNKVNLGISHAKAQGIKAVRGEYVTFIDGDDWLEPLALEKLLEPAEKYNLDLVNANDYRAFKFNLKKLGKANGIEYDTVYCKKEIKEKVFKNFFGIKVYSDLAYWGRLIKTETLKKSKFKPTKTVLYEDIFFNLELILVTERMMFIDYPAYNWRWGGICSGSLNNNEVSYSSSGCIRNFNDFYFRRLKIIEEYDFPQGLTPLRIELYNILRCHLDSVCSPNPNTKDGKEARERLLDAISLPAYREILELRGNPYVKDPAFFDALENKDIDWLYAFFHNIYRRGWKKRALRRILSKIT